MSANWGSVPDWIAGFGTVGATWFVAIQLKRDREHYQEDRRNEEARRLDQEMEQARLITVNIEPVHAEFKVTFTVRNDSTLPIYSARPAVTDLKLSEAGDSAFQALAGYSQEPLNSPAIAYMGGDDYRISAGSEIKFDLVPLLNPGLSLPDPNQVGGIVHHWDGLGTARPEWQSRDGQFLMNMTVTFTYIDAAGRTWARVDRNPPHRMI